jgi:hypothetical protein
MRILPSSRVWTRFEPCIDLGTRHAAARALLSDQRGYRGRCYEGSQDLVDSISNIINGEGWAPVLVDTFSSLLLGTAMSGRDGTVLF